jgi:uncharacterized membrane protein YfcA
MQVYLPIAEIPVNILLIVLLGLATGFLAGMFGIGGGFLATPCLIFIGIPSAVAVATSVNQIISASISGLLAHLKKGNVDIKMGAFLVVGGIFGSSLGVFIFQLIQQIGYVDLLISFCYVLFLGSISLTMISDSLKTILHKNISFTWQENDLESQTTQSSLQVFLKKLPYQVYFEKSNIRTSWLVPVFLSLGVGILVAFMGIGGGFLMIPAMLYILKMPPQLVVGTSLFQIIFIASNTTFLQAITSNNLDFTLSLIMIISSAIGAQFGSKASYRVNPTTSRLCLAILILLICIKIFAQLFIEPENIYSLTVIK